MTPSNESQALTVAPRRELIRVTSDVEVMDSAKFDQMYRIANAMGAASLIPKHLKGQDDAQTKANCFLIVNQAVRWGFDPFAVAPETYEVGGKLGFQGKLIAAVVNTRANLSKRLSYDFNDAKGDALEVTVSGTIEGEDKPRTVKVSVGQARTSNQMWTKDPEQKLMYTGAIKWARRHVPEVILGVLSDDDLEQIRDEQRFQTAQRVKEPDFGEVEVLPATEPTPAAKRGRKPSPQATTAAREATPNTTPTAPVVPTEAPAMGAAAASENPTLAKVISLAGEREITPEKIVAFMQKKFPKYAGIKVLSEIQEKELLSLANILVDPNHAMLVEIRG